MLEARRARTGTARGGDMIRFAASARLVGAALLAALGAAILGGCAESTRYVVVTGDHPLRAPEVRDRHPIWLADGDAAVAAGLIGLNTVPAVRKYGETRSPDGPALEALLFEVVSGDWAAAQQTLRSRGPEVPRYLRLVIRADVTSEVSPASSQGELLRLYQDAYDAQESAAGRAVVELRVRQLRYGR